jgi:UDP-N-acetylglucosamine--N-acetylmuramyl-(pentapeptide) pyrophosphoryl-undecaprenol N-acetylglucosamine transferase
MAFGISSLVISRAGSGAIFEIAAVALPSIVIPIPEDVSHDQTKNAFAYAKSGAATVIKQKNLTPTILINEIDRIMDDPVMWQNMAKAAKEFSKPDASKKIADILIKIALQHES